MGRLSRRILCFFLVGLMIPAFSLASSAEEAGAELHSLHFDIALQEDGSALITETREILFSGDRELTRYGVVNQFAGPRVFSGWQVLSGGTPLSQLDGPDNENRPENTFAVEEEEGKNTVHIYFRQQGSGVRVFQISYRVENAVKLHSDVGEFFWNLTGETGISGIGTLTATLTVPGGVPAEDFLVWAHGPLDGTFEKQPDGSAELKVDNVPQGTVVDIRSTLPAYCFTGGWEQQGEALGEILAEEKELADSANARREQEERERAEREAYWAERNAWEAEHPVLYNIERNCGLICDSVGGFADEYGVYVLFAAVFVIPVLGIFRVFRLIRRIRRRRSLKKFRNSPVQSPRYYRDLPDDRPAPAVDRLVHFYDGKSGISRQISAALLELNLKKLVHFRTEAGETVLLLSEQPDGEHIPDYQELLWKFLLNAAGVSGQISMRGLKNYIRDNQEASLEFRRSFESAVERDFAERVKSKDVENYSPGRWKRRLIISGAAGILAATVRMLSTLYDGVDFGASLKTGLIVFAAVMAVLALCRLGKKLVESPCLVLDQQAENDLALWQAFGRFLDDFTTFDDKELPEFSVWREYMVYAVAMGNGRKAAGALALKYPGAFSAGTDASDDDVCRFLQDAAFFEAADSVGREVAKAKAPVSSDDGSRSDGGGDGGGFSDSGGGSDSGSGGDFID